MPSYNELFPMAILETMNCAKPMLLRDLDIYKDILKDYYLRGNDNEEFIKIIDSIMDKKEEYEVARSLSEKGARFYSRDYVLEMWKEFYDMVYDEKVVNNYEKQ